MAKPASPLSPSGVSRTVRSSPRSERKSTASVLRRAEGGRKSVSQRKEGGYAAPLQTRDASCERPARPTLGAPTFDTRRLSTEKARMQQMRERRPTSEIEQQQQAPGKENTALKRLEGILKESGATKG